MSLEPGRPEMRYDVDFTVYLTWAGRGGSICSASGRCVDLSASGARIEMKDLLPARTMAVVQSRRFGRMGSATVRYCRREGMKYVAGLQFSVAFGLSDSVRRKALDAVLAGKPAA